jgi:hypothetical protein
MQVSCDGSRVEASNGVIACGSTIAAELGTVSDLPYSMIKRLYGVATTGRIALATVTDTSAQTSHDGLYGRSNVCPPYASKMMSSDEGD